MFAGRYVLKLRNRVIWLRDPVTGGGRVCASGRMLMEERSLSRRRWFNAAVSLLSLVLIPGLMWWEWNAENALFCAPIFFLFFNDCTTQTAVGRTVKVMFKMEGKQLNHAVRNLTKAFISFLWKVHHHLLTLMLSQICVNFFNRTQTYICIILRTSVTKQHWTPIDLHCMETTKTFSKISSFVFQRKKKESNWFWAKCRWINDDRIHYTSLPRLWIVFDTSELERDVQERRLAETCWPLLKPATAAQDGCVAVNLDK